MEASKKEKKLIGFLTILSNTKIQKFNRSYRPTLKSKQPQQQEEGLLQEQYLNRNIAEELKLLERSKELQKGKVQIASCACTPKQRNSFPLIQGMRKKSRNITQIGQKQQNQLSLIKLRSKQKLLESIQKINKRKKFPRMSTEQSYTYQNEPFYNLNNLDITIKSKQEKATKLNKAKGFKKTMKTYRKDSRDVSEHDQKEKFTPYPVQPPKMTKYENQPVSKNKKYTKLMRNKTTISEHLLQKPQASDEVLSRWGNEEFQNYLHMYPFEM